MNLNIVVSFMHFLITERMDEHIISGLNKIQKGFDSIKLRQRENSDFFFKNMDSILI